jgi:predicted TIM-barrel fold metal-dependent hydrolase
MKSDSPVEPGKIFDIHVHLLAQPDADAEFLRFAHEWKMPFAISCLGPDGSMLPNPSVDEVRRANDKVLKLMEQEPGMAHGFCYINPLHGRQSLDEIRRCVSGNGMSGIKLWIACPCSDESVFPIFEESIALGVPVLQHSWKRIDGPLQGESTAADVAAAAKRYTDAQIIMAHMAFNWRIGIDAIKDCPNVWADTSGTDPEMGSVEYAVRMLGAERVLYGSDAPCRDILIQLGKIPAAEISCTDKEKILHLNAERLLKPAGAER